MRGVKRWMEEGNRGLGRREQRGGEEGTAHHTSTSACALPCTMAELMATLSSISGTISPRSVSIAFALRGIKNTPTWTGTIGAVYYIDNIYMHM